jgi:hypothetical protein
MEVPVSSAKNRLSGLIRRALIAEIREGTRGRGGPAPAGGNRLAKLRLA